MKKMILCAAALLFGTMAFAQVSGAPDAQVVTPLAGTAGHMNAGESVQYGDDNAVRVRQAGTENSVYTEQDNGSGGGGNLARIMQTGDVQAGISAYQNAAEVLQSGDDNQSTTIQEGDLNNAYTGQGQNDDSSARNKARIQQGIGQQAESNYAAIEQDGDDNQASTLQIFDNSDAWTDQDGDGNGSMIVQNAGPNGSSGHLAQNKQNGDNNESSIDQSGAGGTNSAYAFQYGDDNQAKQLQTTTAVAGMTGNTGLIVQGYDGAALPAAPLAIANAIFSDINSSVDDTFINGGTTGSGTGQSFGGIAFQIQNGKENTATAFQYGSDASGSNYSKQTQAWGWGNEALVIQNRGGGPGGGDNEAEQYQAGDNNTVGVAQNGEGHKSYQTQIGHRNSSLAAQQDAGNLLNTHQRGNDNYATSAQRGIANATLIVQYGGNSYVAQQNLDGLGGGGNQIDVLQLGPDGDFYNDAIECDFNDQMDPWMDYTVPGFDLDPICPDC